MALGGFMAKEEEKETHPRESHAANVLRHVADQIEGGVLKACKISYGFERGIVQELYYEEPNEPLHDFQDPTQNDNEDTE